LIAMQGPRAAAIAAAMDPRAATIERFGVAELELGGVRVLAARTGYTGEDGFEFFVATEKASALWKLLLEAGQGDGLIPAGLGARDTLRLEAALPLYGHELGGDISPFEVRVGWAVKLDRPELIGQKALAAAKEAGAKRRLVGLLPEGGIAREGAAVFLEGGEAPVGYVTSGSHSPTLGRPVAMALVDAQLKESAFEVEIRKKRRPATMTSLPFYARQAL
jgi:aminomethyltransferase